MLDRCSARRFDHPSLDVDIRSTSFLEIPLCKKFPRKKVYKWKKRLIKLSLSDDTLHSMSFYMNIFLISLISRLHCLYCMHSLLILREIIERKERKRERFSFIPINFLLKLNFLNSLWFDREDNSIIPLVLHQFHPLYFSDEMWNALGKWLKNIRARVISIDDL